VPDAITLNRPNPFLIIPFGWEDILPTGLGEITVTVVALVVLANGGFCVLDASITENIQ
jgi:hypothetical protein